MFLDLIEDEKFRRGKLCNLLVSKQGKKDKV